MAGDPGRWMVAGGVLVALAGLVWWAGRVRLRVHLACRLRRGALHGRIGLASPGDRVLWRSRGHAGRTLALLALAGLLLPVPPGDDARGALPRLWRRLRVRRLRWWTRLGAPDAALAALLAGAAWAAKGAAVAQLARRHGPLAEPPRLELEPRCDRWGIESRAECIVELRARDIMAAAPAAWRLWRAAGRAPRRRRRPAAAPAGADRHPRGWAWDTPSSS